MTNTLPEVTVYHSFNDSIISNPYQLERQITTGLVHIRMRFNIS